MQDVRYNNRKRWRWFVALPKILSWAEISRRATLSLGETEYGRQLKVKEADWKDTR